METNELQRAKNGLNALLFKLICPFFVSRKPLFSELFGILEGFRLVYGPERSLEANEPEVGTSGSNTV